MRSQKTEAKDLPAIRGTLRNGWVQGFEVFLVALGFGVAFGDSGVWGQFGLLRIQVLRSLFKLSLGLRKCSTGSSVSGFIVASCPGSDPGCRVASCVQGF